jgi:hypothetical protein
MRPGWYILNYHNVDWEDSILSRAIGGTVRPDVFRGHLQTLRRLGRFISIPEGQDLLEGGEPIAEPLFSLWFDDGFAGVREEALPICRELGVRGALSVCSRFVLRTELFWRCKLSYLAHGDGIRLVRSRLRRDHPDLPLRVRAWTLDSFGPDVIAAIDEVFEHHTTEAFRRDAFRIFETPDGLRELASAGWTITNHGAAHYPLPPQLEFRAVEAAFDECETLVRDYNPANRYWVIPFSGSAHHLEDLQRRAVVVEVARSRNTVESWRATGRLFRHAAPASRDIRVALG